MRIGVVLLLAICGVQLCHASGPTMSDLVERRHAAAVAFHDGIFLVHAADEMSITADGFRQDPFFYYYTGFENTPGAILALDGTSGESWLFLPSKVPFLTGMPSEVAPGATGEASKGNCSAGETCGASPSAATGFPASNPVMGSRTEPSTRSSSAIAFLHFSNEMPLRLVAPTAKKVALSHSRSCCESRFAWLALSTRTKQPLARRPTRLLRHNRGFVAASKQYHRQHKRC